MGDRMTVFNPGKGLRLPIPLFCLCLVLALIPSRPVMGEVSCHCFKQREYQPDRPASADPYILATARNSLLAAASHNKKGDVVRARMTGATERDLWFSLFLALRTGTPTSTLKEARSRSGSWAAALDSLALPTEGLGPTFEAARKRGDEEGMSVALADLALAGGFDVDGKILRKLRSAGAGNAETVLCLLLAERGKRPPETILEDVITRRQTWGSLLHSAGIAPGSVGELIQAEY